MGVDDDDDDDDKRLSLTLARRDVQGVMKHLNPVHDHVQIRPFLTF
jgi:hypothetical protein